MFQNFRSRSTPTSPVLHHCLTRNDGQRTEYNDARLTAALSHLMTFEIPSLQILFELKKLLVLSPYLRYTTYIFLEYLFFCKEDNGVIFLKIYVIIHSRVLEYQIVCEQLKKQQRGAPTKKKCSENGISNLGVKLKPYYNDTEETGYSKLVWCGKSVAVERNTISFRKTCSMRKGKLKIYKSTCLKLTLPR